MTQQELADATGLSLVYISQLEAPNSVYCPSVKALFKLAEAMSIRTYKLLDVEDD
ncbi:hypothetical protein FACS189492_1230 [Clostridia bacterium]|nr:hypothetical protein FACS189492_1230 [Clostridia bacterium]